MRPVDELLKRQMRTADKAELRLGIDVLPNAGIACFNPCKLRIVDHIGLCTLCDERFTLLDRFRGQAFDVVQADGAVARGRSAEILQVGDGVAGQFVSDELREPFDIGDVLHDLHADGAAKDLRFRFFGRLDLDDPGRLAALVCQKAKVRHITDDAAEQLQNAGVAVAARTQNTVGIDHGTAFRPAQNVALLGTIADLVKITGTGESVLFDETEFLKLRFIGGLLAVHEFEHKILQKIARHVRIERARIHGELLLGKRAGLDELIHQRINGLHNAETKAGHQVAVFTGDGNHLFRAERLAVHHESFHDFGDGFAPRAVQNGLLFGAQNHFTHRTDPFCKTDRNL